MDATKISSLVKERQTKEAALEAKWQTFDRQQTEKKEALHQEYILKVKACDDKWKTKLKTLLKTQEAKFDSMVTLRYVSLNQVHDTFKKHH